MPELRPDSQRPSRAATFGLIALAILSLTLFSWRGLLHSPRLYDFRTGYAASRAWIFGHDPYGAASLDDVWNDAGGRGFISAGAVGVFPSFYPPTAFVALSPFSILPAKAACAVWVIASLLLLATMIVQLGRLAGLSAQQHFFLACVILLLGPVQSGANAGQQCVVAISCIVIALRQMQVRRLWLAWPLLVYAMCLKPQLAMPFVAWEFLRCPRAALAAMAVWLMVLGGGLWHLQQANTPWRSSLEINYQHGHEPGGGLDFTFDNPFRDHLMNAEVPAYAVLKNTTAAHVTAISLAAGFALLVLTRWRSIGFTWRRDRPRPPREIDELLGLSVVSAILLLPLYHRYYDAIILVIPIAWAIRHGSDARGKIVLLFTLPLLLPVAWATNLVQKGYVPKSIMDGPAWNLLIMPLFGWLLLTWCAVLVGMWMRHQAGIEDKTLISSS